MSDRSWEVWHGKGSQGGKQYLNDWGDPRDPSTWGSGKEYRLKKAASLQMGTSALDVGCGIGHLYYLLKDSVDYVGVDNSDDQLMVARKVFPEAVFKSADIYNLKNEALADTVYCLSVLIHLPDFERPLQQLWNTTEKCLVFNVVTIPLRRIDRVMAQYLHRNLKSFNRVDTNPKNPGVIFNRYTKEYVLDICSKMPDVERIDVYEGYINSEDDVRKGSLGLMYVRMVKSPSARGADIENPLMCARKAGQ